MSYNPNPYQQPYVSPYQSNYGLNSYGQNQYGSQQSYMQSQQPANAQFVQQPSSNIEYVNGIEGAKALTLMANCKKVVFDSDGHLTTAVSGIIADIWDCSKELVDCYWIVT